MPWQRVDFTDNAAVLELLEAKHVGVFALLDEESRLQKGNAESYVEKLKNQQKQSAAFSVPKGRAKGSGAPFSISHYAGLVTYDTQLFISKNTDPLHPELVEMASGSASSYVSQLFTKATAASGAPASKRGTAMYSATIGSTFKTQLNELMSMIGATDVHYVRCVKPNAASVPHEFTDELVADQLRFAGMLEAVRISRAAFPHRLELLAFAGHFGALAAAVVAAAAEAPLAERVAKLLTALLPDGGEGKEYYQGKTKVFLRAGVLAGLDLRRTELRSRTALSVQRIARGRAARALRRRALNAVGLVERCARLFLRRRRAERQVRARSTMQARARGQLARRRVENLRRQRAATSLQALARRRRCSTDYTKQRKAASLLQGRARTQRAMRDLQERLEEMRLKKSYEGQLAEARERLQAEADEKSQLVTDKARLAAAAEERREQAEELAMLLKQQEEELRHLRAELEASKKSLAEEGSQRSAAERRAEQAQLQLSVERSEHQKTARNLELERSAHAGAKARLKANAKAEAEAAAASGAAADAPSVVAQSSGSGLTVDTGAAEAAAGAVGGGAPSPGVALRAQIQASTLAEKEKALGEAQQQVVAFRSKLEHARHEGTQQREKAARQKQLHEQSRAKWETERAKLQRQLQNVKTDVEKRTAWLDKVRTARQLAAPPLTPTLIAAAAAAALQAKGIIEEYQKRASLCTCQLAQPQMGRR